MRLTGALVLLAFAVGGSCAAAQQANDIPETQTIAAGTFVMGSDRSERETAYRLDEKVYGHSATRKGRWYEIESARHDETLPQYRITRTPITNAQYSAFVAETRHAAPDVDSATWKSYRLNHPYAHTRRYAWAKAAPPAGRESHPVVLVSLSDARAYAAWLSRKTGSSWRLPTEAEWEKAARGTDGRWFPWGNVFRAENLNSADRGPFDTTPVGAFAAGASPFGLLDVAGQVFEWTSTPDSDGKFIVKGGSWDDKGCGVCRPAARHGRPAGIKHIIIGFRLVRE